MPFGGRHCVSNSVIGQLPVEALPCRPSWRSKSFFPHYRAIILPRRINEFRSYIGGHVRLDRLGANDVVCNRLKPGHDIGTGLRS